jgi:hypothetical protein
MHRSSVYSITFVGMAEQWKRHGDFERLGDLEIYEHLTLAASMQVQKVSHKLPRNYIREG